MLKVLHQLYQRRSLQLLSTKMSSTLTDPQQTSTTNINQHDETVETAKKKQKLDDGPSLPTIDSSSEACVPVAPTIPVASATLVKKRKYALLIGYSGEGYFGLQRNASIKTKEFPTIEDEIVDALVKVNAIPQQHADEMYKHILILLFLK